MAPALAGGTWFNGRVAFPQAGRVGLVEFTADWCGPCRASYPTLKALHRAYVRQGLRIVLATSIRPDFLGKPVDRAAWLTAAQHYFIDSVRAPFPVRVAEAEAPKVDGGEPGGHDYVVQPIPQMVLVDRTGRVRQVILDWNPDIAQRLAPVIEALLSEGAAPCIAERIEHRPRPRRGGQHKLDGTASTAE
jgi:thiol-disulfide isomerase/thioredoxin